MKKLLLLVAILLALLIAAALAAPYFISADMIKAQVIEKVTTATGRTLTIDGPLQVKFFPVAGVMAEKVTLSNPPGFNDNTPFISLDTLKVDVEFMPLLHRDVVIKSFVLDTPRINLHANKDSVQNWQFARKEKEDSKESRSSSAAAISLPSNLRLSDVEIKNGTVIYADDAKKQHFEGTKLDATLSLRSMDSPLNIKGSGEWNGAAVKVSGEITTPESYLSKEKTNISLDVSGKSKVELLALHIQGSVEKEVFNGKATLKSASLKETMRWLDANAKPLPTPAALALDIGGDAQCAEKSCNVSNVTFTLDDIKGKGSLKVVTGDKKPAIDLNLDVGKLDLNPFLQHEDKADSIVPAGGAAKAPTHGNEAVDLSALQAFNGKATIQTDGIAYRKLTIGKTTLRAALQQGRLTADMADAEMYSGKGTLAVVVDGSAATPSYETKASLKGIAVEPLLKAAADMDRLSGNADIDFATTSHGVSQKEIIGTLAGKGQFKLSNGSIKRVNLIDMLHNIQAAFGNAGGSNQNTPINQMNGTFTISQGVISNQDMVMEMLDLSVKGQGDINLPANTIKYRLSPQMMGKAQGGEAKGGLAVPVIIEGSLDHPSFKPDLGAALQNALQNPQQFREQLKNTERGFKGQSGNSKDTITNLKGLLKGL